VELKSQEKQSFCFGVFAAKNAINYANVITASIFCGLYYKHVTIVNYASTGINKLRASLHDDARVII
jgi:hypothetical protein